MADPTRPVTICQHAGMEVCCSPLGDGMDARQAEEAAELLKVLADPARLRILSVVANGGEACVCDLTDPLGLSQPTVSHHMKVLRESGFIQSERRGRWVYHRLVRDRLEQVKGLLTVPDHLSRTASAGTTGRG
jgi:ArsR family transcriptional regulator, arsenate/arsenite/antimonite-responsive transcriptional repressor